MSTELQYCTFMLGDLFLGIEVLQVQEVIRPQSVTRVPLGPKAIRGLINLRGQIVTAIELRERLGLPPRPEDRPAMNVVVRTDEGAVSLLVDEIGDVIEVEEGQHEPLPETLSGIPRALIRGVYKLPKQLMLVLDLDAVLGLEAKI
jgi:purine-binding chemotaxis protein CheW